MPLRVLPAEDDAGLALALGARDVVGGVDLGDEVGVVAQPGLPARDVAHGLGEILPHAARAVRGGDAALAHVLEHAAAEIGDVEAVDDDQPVVELGHLARPSLGCGAAASARSSVAAASVAERPIRGQGKSKDRRCVASRLRTLLAEALTGTPGLGAPVALARAEGGLRCRHRRRRRAWPGDRLLPRQGAWAPQHRRAGEGLDRRRQHRPQHHHHPLQLPPGRERRHLRARAQAVGGPVAGAQLQRHVLASAAS